MCANIIYLSWKKVVDVLSPIFFNKSCCIGGSVKLAMLVPVSLSSAVF